MMNLLDDLRTAHIEGFTFAAYADDHKSIVTGGTDGDIRVYPGLYEDETISLSLGSKITAFAVEGTIVLVANDDNEVKSFLLPSMVSESVLLRFTASVNHVYIRGDAKLVGAASSDFSIKVVDMDGNNQKTFTGHNAPVLSLHIGDDTMISSSCDGSLRLWNLEDQKCIRTVDILSKSNSLPDSMHWFSVAQESKMLAVPFEKSIKIITTQSWTEVCALEDHQEEVSVLQWSNCGKYLASAATNGEIFCWEVATKKCLAKFQHHLSKGVTSLIWSKEHDGELLFSTMDGEFGFCNMPLQQANKVEAGNLDDGIFDDIDMDDELFQVSSTKKQKKRNISIEEEEEEENDDGSVPSSKKTRINNMDNFLDDEADDDDDDIDDDNNISLNLLKEGILPQIKQSIIEDEDENSMSSFIVDKPPSPTKTIKTVEMELQEPFQPSSTALHLAHRFMVWNSIGIIRCHVEDDISSIDVEFHDASTHHPLHIPNVLNHSMAALSSTAVVFACESQENIPSKLTCLHFGSWDSNNDWDISMSKEEEVEGIAVNCTHIAVSTSKRLIRIYTISGFQTQLISLPGPFVSMAMHEKQLMVVYHESGGFKKCQCLGILQLHLRKNLWKVISDNTFVMKPKEILTWIGFSVEGTPVMVDSSGDVLLHHRQQSGWIPIANTKDQVKNKSDNYWVIGVEECQHQVRCIYCKASNFPATLPRPIPTVIPFQIPLCEISTEKSMKEQELLKCNLMSSNVLYNKETFSTQVEIDLEDVERQQIRLLMQLFALACKSDHDYRAVEVCNLMPNAESIGLAIQYASKLKRMRLAQRLAELARKRATAEEEEEEEEEEEDFYEDDEIFEEKKPNGLNEKRSTGINIHNVVKTNGPKMIINRVRSSNSIIPTPSADEKEEEIAEKDDELTLSQYESENKETVSSGTIHSLPASQPVNPFKMSSQKSSNGESRGAEYFASLDRQKLAKKSKTMVEKSCNVTKKDSHSVIKKETERKGKPKHTKNATLSFGGGCKNSIDTKKIEKNDSTDESISDKPSAVKSTGFQLFLDNQKEKQNGSEEQENIIPKVMRQWKELTIEDKKMWNDKAKSQTVQRASKKLAQFQR